MAFKGGTPLSKVYNLIHLFSEDVDITIDYRNFFSPIDIEQASRSKLKRISAELKSCLVVCIQETILTHLQHSISRLPNEEKFSIEFDGNELLHFNYPTVLSFRDAYLKDHVLLEFGVRNSAEPSERRLIKTLLSGIQFDRPLNFPEAEVNVLSPLRTFWEKATLIHVECHRKRLVRSPERLSRHWYDLAMLKKAALDKEALSRRDILEKVVEHKKAFFNASYANYDHCLEGSFRLIPDDEEQKQLELDYTAMERSGLFSEVPFSFAEILNSLRELESELNIR